MMMFDIDPEVAKLFFKGELTSGEVTKLSGISSLMPGAIINDWMFEPCGYSLNALLDQTHFTIHVTPEPACSFVSFATNAKVLDYSKLMSKVLDIFKPRKFTATLFADIGVSSNDDALEKPFKPSTIECADRKFVLSSRYLFN